MHEDAKLSTDQQAKEKLTSKTSAHHISTQSMKLRSIHNSASMHQLNQSSAPFHIEAKSKGELHFET